MQNMQFSFPIDELANRITGNVISEVKRLLETQSAIVPPPTVYLNRKEAATLLGVSLPTLNEWTKSGVVQGYRLASRVRYIQAELESSLVSIKTRRAA